jgi:hypothetical protein
MLNRNDKIKTNRRNRTEPRGFEAVNLVNIEQPKAVTSDRENALLSRELRTVAQNQITTSVNVKGSGTERPSLPVRSSGPLKMGKTEDELESGPSLAPAVHRTFGTSDGDLTAELLLQVTRALPNAGPLDPLGNHALAALHGIAPRDSLEGLLAVEMVSVHNFAMDLMARGAMKGQSPEGMERCGNLATKLLRTFIAQIEALDRHRGQGGEQKMNVEHAHIHDGTHGVEGPVGHPGSSVASAEDREKSN